jgi:hypothetical protein
MRQTEYFFELTLRMRIVRNGATCEAFIQDGPQRFIGSGKSRGDALNSAVKRWLNSINPDTLFNQTNTAFQSYRTHLPCEQLPPSPAQKVNTR